MKPFYKTKAWKIKREKILRRDGYMSGLAKRYGRRIPGETVHHILPRDVFPEYQLADWNLVTVTRDEHNKLHDRMTGELTQEGVDLLKRTARKQGLNEDEILRRLAEGSGTLPV